MADASKIMEAMATHKEDAAQAPTELPETSDIADESVKTEEVTGEDTPEAAEPSHDPVNDNVDHDWKKRYADLKRYLDTDMKKQLAEERKLRLEAETALKSKTHKYVREEDLQKFEEEYGEIAPIVKELAFKEAEALFQARWQEEENRKQAEDADKAEKTKFLTEAQRLVAEKHPDYEAIGKSKIFQTWLSQQLDVTKGLAGSSDPQAVILVLDMYKKDTGYAAKKTAETKKTKSEAVIVPQESTVPSAPAVLDVSKLKKEIEKAQRTGDHKKLGQLLQQFDKSIKKGN